MAFKNIEMKHQGGNLRQRINQAMAWIADLVIVALLGPVLLVIIYAYKACRYVREKWYACRNVRNGGQGRPVGAMNGDDDWFQGLDLPTYWILCAAMEVSSAFDSCSPRICEFEALLRHLPQIKIFRACLVATHDIAMITPSHKPLTLTDYVC